MTIAIKLAFIMLSITVVGTLGYMILSDCPLLDSFYMTVITIATVGYAEICPTNDATRIFTALLIMSSFAILGYATSKFAEIMTSGEIGKIMKRRKFMKMIEKMKDHFIVCGASGTGIHIIKELTNTGRKVVVIDIDEKKLEDLEKTFEIVSVVGNAKHEKTLLDAGIKNAAGLAACLSDDSDNILIVVTAHYLAPNVKIVSRANEEENIQKFKNVGADYVVSDKMIGGLRMASSLIRPTTVEFLDEMLRGKGGKIYRFEDLKIPDKFVGKTIKEVFESKNMLAMALKRNREYIYAPRDDTKLEKDDIVILLAQPKDIKDLLES